MTVAPLIAMKSSQVKSFDAVGRELDRRAHTYANDVDQSGRHIGYRCRAEDERPVPLEKEAKAEGKSTGAYARGILADGLMAIA